MTYKKEAHAKRFCMIHFLPNLYGKKFPLVTDDKPLV